MTAVDLTGQTVIVTGAGRGLGRAHALSLSGRWDAVVVNDLSQVHADEVVGEIVGAGGRAAVSAQSVADPAAGQAIVEMALDTFGTVDALVNNADFEDQTPATLSAQLDVHVAGSFFLTQAAWPAGDAQEAVRAGGHDEFGRRALRHGRPGKLRGGQGRRLRASRRPSRSKDATTGSSSMRSFPTPTPISATMTRSWAGIVSEPRRSDAGQPHTGGISAPGFAKP